MSTLIEQSQLESHLWEAANILRGPVDAADFKTYVFPLLFFKRISDVFDEEYAAALAESGGDEEYALFPQNYRFQIPHGCHWSDVRRVTTNFGQRTIQDAIENLLIKERLDLEPQLRELDGKVESIELRLRSLLRKILGDNPAQIPQHVAQKVEERISRALKKNASMDAGQYATVAGMLEYFDLREIQDTIVAKPLWPHFEPSFSNKESLATKFDQLAELRNGIRHSRSVNEVTRMEGEASILWFNQVLSK